MAVLKLTSIICLTYLAVNLCSGGTGHRSQYKTMANPYVTLYANEFYKGAQHVVFLRGGCKNLPSQHEKWASSVNTHNRCIDVCSEKDCEGQCIRLYPSATINTDSSLRLSALGMNDRISSLKSCYTIVKKN